MRSRAGGDGVRGPSQGWLLALRDVTEGPVQDEVPGPAEPVVFVAFGPVLMAGAAYAQAGEVPFPVILLSIPVGMVTAGVLLGYNLRDADEESGAGAKTLVHVVGVGSVKALYLAFVIVSPLMTAGFAAFRLVPMGTIMALVSLVPAAPLAVRSVRRQRIPDIDARTARFGVVFMGMTGVGIVI